MTDTPAEANDSADEADPTEPPSVEAEPTDEAAADEATTNEAAAPSVVDDDDATGEMAVPAPGATQATQVEDPEAEIARLRAERDELAAEVEKLERPKRQGRIRAIAVGALVVLLCITFLASTIGVWGKRSALNNEVFADRVAPLGADPAIQGALGVFITDQIMQTIDPETIFKDALPDQAKILAVPLAGVVQSFVSDQVNSFLASQRFADLWAQTTTRAHATAVQILEDDSEVISANGDEIVINLIPIINEALAQIGQQSPEIFGRTVDLPTVTVDQVPEQAKEALSNALDVPLSDDFGVITVKSGGGALSTAQTIVQWINVGVWALVALTVLLIPFTLWLSRRRRRTLLQMTAGLIIVTVLLRRVVMTLLSEGLGRLTNEVNRAAADAAITNFTDPLLSYTVWILWGLAIIGIIALVTGPYAWAVYLRATAVQLARRGVSTATNLGDRATSDESIAWLTTNYTGMQVAGAAVGVVLLVWLDLTWLGLFVLALLIGAYELGLWWLAGRDRPQSGDESDPTDLAPPPPPSSDVIASGTPF